MSARHTIERILRDPDDASGQTIREWKIEVEDATVTISGSRHRPESWIIIRLEDIDQFKRDLDAAVFVQRSGGIVP